MAEYIERETAMDIFGEGPMWTGYFEPYPLEVHLAIVGVAKLIREEIGKIPAADVAPVVHGRWVNFYGDFSTAECSECESQFEVTFDDESNGALWDGFRQFYNYCPTCGAKMDGKGEEA